MSHGRDTTNRIKENAKSRIATSYLSLLGTGTNLVSPFRIWFSEPGVSKLWTRQAHEPSQFRKRWPPPRVLDATDSPFLGEPPSLVRTERDELWNPKYPQGSTSWGDVCCRFCSLQNCPVPSKTHLICGLSPQDDYPKCSARCMQVGVVSASYRHPKYPQGNDFKGDDRHKCQAASPQVHPLPLHKLLMWLPGWYS